MITPTARLLLATGLLLPLTVAGSTPPPSIDPDDVAARTTLLPGPDLLTPAKGTKPASGWQSVKLASGVLTSRKGATNSVQDVFPAPPRTFDTKDLVRTRRDPLKFDHQMPAFQPAPVKRGAAFPL